MHSRRVQDAQRCLRRVGERGSARLPPWRPCRGARAAAAASGPAQRGSPRSRLPAARVRRGRPTITCPGSPDHRTQGRRRIDQGAGRAGAAAGLPQAAAREPGGRTPRRPRLGAWAAVPPLRSSGAARAVERREFRRADLTGVSRDLRPRLDRTERFSTVRREVRQHRPVTRGAAESDSAGCRIWPIPGQPRSRLSRSGARLISTGDTIPAGWPSANTRARPSEHAWRRG